MVLIEGQEVCLRLFKRRLPCVLIRGFVIYIYLSLDPAADLIRVLVRHQQTAELSSLIQQSTVRPWLLRGPRFAHFSVVLSEF
jgi:hypothetical protein